LYISENLTIGTGDRRNFPVPTIVKRPDTSAINGNACVIRRNFPLYSNVKPPENPAVIGNACVKRRDFTVSSNVKPPETSAILDSSGNPEGITRSYEMKHFPFPGQFGLAASDNMRGITRPVL
jgi:hypothetical protein